MNEHGAIGIIGGNGTLGSALARALLRCGMIAPDRLHVSCRSGQAPALAQWPGVQISPSNQALAESCGTLILAVPPTAMGEVGISASGKLVISVIAGVTAARIANETGARAVIRAMSSPPASDLGLAFSPFWAASGATVADRDIARAILASTGFTAELAREDEIDRFTALTGPVPGVLAAFAEAMQAYAERHGTPPETAERAIRQLFHAAGEIIGRSGASPATHVAEMIAYDGTTAAALRALRAGALADAIAEGLDAAVARAREMS